jgi:GNAT superfamily N-acetyltransferase
MNTLHYTDPPPELASHAPDAYLEARDEDGVAARCSLWWKDVPALPGERVGVAGHFSCAGESDSAEAAAMLLEEAAARLAREGCTLAIGPMDGNTWRKYRLVTERGEEPPFLMEPDHPAEWPEHWREAGFGPLAQYFSALGTDLAKDDPQISRAGERLRAAGITVRALRADDYENELRRIYEVSAVAFTDNYLYTPLPEAEFVAQYAAVKARVRPDLVLMAELSGKPAGYVFTIPDWLRGPATDTVIVKTLAALPGRQTAGLGAWLLQEVQQRAHVLGFRRVIHALMHESNNSLNLSRRFCEPFRRYTLFSRRLA